MYCNCGSFSMLWKRLGTRLFRISTFEIRIGVLKMPPFFAMKASLFRPLFTLGNYSDTFLPDRCIFKAGRDRPLHFWFGQKRRGLFSPDFNARSVFKYVIDTFWHSYTAEIIFCHRKDLGVIGKNLNLYCDEIVTRKSQGRHFCMVFYRQVRTSAVFHWLSLPLRIFFIL